MVVANFIGSPWSGFSSNTNQVSLFFSSGIVEDISVMSKYSLSHLCMHEIEAAVCPGDFFACFNKIFF